MVELHDPIQLRFGKRRGPDEALEPVDDLL